MRASTFRRLGGAVLLVLFLPSCTDVPTLPRQPEVPVAPGASASPEGAALFGTIEHRRTRGALEVRLVSGRDGTLRHMIARKAGRPAVHLRWHYRADGSVGRVAATLYLPNGRAREIPDVTKLAGPTAPAALFRAPAPLAASSAYGSCWVEWIVLMDILIALLYAQLEEQWELVASLTLAAMRASWELQRCLWMNGDTL